MAFALTPVTAPTTPAPLPQFIQFQQDGVNLGEPDVAIVDFVVDPALVQITRGYGEDYDTITLRRAAAPPPPGASTGWLNPVNDSLAGVALHANTGVVTYTDGPYNNIYAGIVGYTSGTVLWSVVSWAPLSGGPQPVLFQDNARADVLRVNLNNSGPVDAGLGLLTLTASVDGVPAVDALVLSIAINPSGGGGSLYPGIAWGPAP